MDGRLLSSGAVHDIFCACVGRQVTFHLLARTGTVTYTARIYKVCPLRTGFYVYLDKCLDHTGNHEKIGAITFYRAEYSIGIKSDGSYELTFGEENTWTIHAHGSVQVDDSDVPSLYTPRRKTT